MRICVVGAGAIGGVIASGLASAGVETSVYARGATLAALRSRGLSVESADGAVTVKVAASDDAAELGPQDFVVLAVKAQSLPAAVTGIGPLLGPDTAVLSTLNGVPWWFFDGFGGPVAGRHLDSVDPGGRIAAVLPATPRDRRHRAPVRELARARPGPAVQRERPHHRRAVRRGNGAARRSRRGAARRGLRRHGLTPHSRGRLVQAVGQPDA